MRMRLLLLVALGVILLGVPGICSDEVSAQAKPTWAEWNQKKNATKGDKDDYRKKRNAYIANPTPGTKKAMENARTKYMASAIATRSYRVKLQRKQPNE